MNEFTFIDGAMMALGLILYVYILARVVSGAYFKAKLQYHRELAEFMWKGNPKRSLQ